MLPQSIIKKSQRGAYQPVQDLDDDDHAGNASQAELKNDHHNNQRPNFLWLYLTLAAFSGFVVAIAMVNLFPGNLGPEHASSKLEKLLKSTLNSVGLEGKMKDL